MSDATHSDTYMMFVGSGALSYPWYTNVAMSPDNWCLSDEGAYEGWHVTFMEYTGDGPPATKAFTLNHDAIVGAAKRVSADDFECRETLKSECRQFLADPEMCDFDADYADVVIQVATFGEIRYG